MDRRSDEALDTRHPVESGGADGSANLKMLVIAAAFLMVTIGLVLLQPGVDPEAAPQVAETTVTVPVTPATTPEVTRADASLLDLENLSASEAVSRRLRQPIRLTDTSAGRTDMRTLTATVLAGFGHEVRDGDRLQSLLVQALTEGQSNAYIDALLNTAAARGDFTTPVQLRLTSGRLNTPALLSALVRQAQG